MQHQIRQVPSQFQATDCFKIALNKFQQKQQMRLYLAIAVILRTHLQFKMHSSSPLFFQLLLSKALYLLLKPSSQIKIQVLNFQSRES